MSSSTFDSEAFVAGAVTFVRRDFKDLTKAAIVGYDEQLHLLLEALPGKPAPESLIGQKIAAWIDMQKVDLAIQQVRSGIQIPLTALDEFMLATWGHAATIPDDGRDDFHPSRLLLSGTLRVDYGRTQGQPTDYSVVSREDPAVWTHPFVLEESSSTRRWFKGTPSGRRTPVPEPLKVKPAVIGRRRLTSSPPNPIIAQPQPLRPHSLFPLHAPEPSTQHKPEELEPRGRIVAGPRSRRTGSASRSRSRASRIKSEAYVQDSGDEDRKGEVKVVKGRQKAREMDDEMDVDKESAPLPPMDVDAPPIAPSGVARPRSAGIIRIKPLLKVSVPVSDVPSTSAPEDGPSDSASSCERCTRMKRVCEFPIGGIACMACHKAKSKCTLVPAGWRKQIAATKSPKAAKSPAHRPKTPHRSATPEDGLKTRRTRSQSRARSIAPADPKPSEQAGEASLHPPNPPPHASTPLASTSLGPVPSQYLYLLSREGKEVSTGIRVNTTHMGDIDQGAKERDERIQQLEETNRVLVAKNQEMEGSMRKMRDDLTALKNTMAVLLAGQNGHTATLESHRRLLQDQQQHSQQQSQHSSVRASGSPMPVFIPPPHPTPDSFFSNDIPQNLPQLPAMDVWPPEILNMNTFGSSAITADHPQSPSQFLPFQSDPLGDSQQQS